MPATNPLGPMVRIRDLRKARNWTLNEMADRIGEQGVDVTFSTISNVETGRYRASDKLLTAWASALGLDPMDVWHGPTREEATTGETSRDSDAA